MNKKDFFRKCVEEKSFPRNDVEKQIILLGSIQNLEMDVYLEDELNQIIKRYFEESAEGRVTVCGVPLKNILLTI